MPPQPPNQGSLSPACLNHSELKSLLLNQTVITNEELKKTLRDQVEPAMGLSKFIQELHTKDWPQELVLI